MSTQEVFIQQFARLFHHYQEVLGAEPQPTAGQHSDPRPNVPVEERDRMVTAARLAIQEMETTAQLENPRQYYAVPGQAEWGC